MTRVYVPSSPARLGELAAEQRARRERGEADSGASELGPVPAAYAVTGSLRAAVPDADEEELEYLAMTLAARRSVEQLQEAEPPRRVVLACEAADVREVHDTADSPGLVSVDVLPFRDVVSIHLDAPEAEAAVERALRATRSGAAEAEELVVACDDHELAWYAVTELELVEEVRSTRNG